MHITDGVMNSHTIIPVSIIGGLFLILSLKKIKEDDLAKTALFSALFFTASFIHVPVGVSSAHLILGGIVGLALGWGVFTAIFLALFLQALLFGFGGLGTLFVNMLIMSLPPFVISTLVKKTKSYNHISYFMVGFFSVLCSSLMLCSILWIDNPNLAPAAIAVFIAHIPLAIAEGVITLLCMGFYAKIQGSVKFA